MLDCSTESSLMVRSPAGSLDRDGRGYIGRSCAPHEMGGRPGASSGAMQAHGIVLYHTHLFQLCAYVAIPRSRCSSASITPVWLDGNTNYVGGCPSCQDAVSGRPRQDFTYFPDSPHHSATCG